MKKPLIAPRCIGLRIPFFQAATAWLLMDRLQVQGYVHGIVWTMFALFTLIALSQIFTTDPKDVVFKD